MSRCRIARSRLDNLNLQEHTGLVLLHGNQKLKYLLRIPNTYSCTTLAIAALPYGSATCKTDPVSYRAYANKSQNRPDLQELKHSTSAIFSSFDLL